MFSHGNNAGGVYDNPYGKVTIEQEHTIAKPSQQYVIVFNENYSPDLT